MLTRRQLMKLGILSGGYTLLGPGSGRRTVLANEELPASPVLRPFVTSLPIPPPPPEVPAFLEPDCEAGGFVGANTRFFRLVEEEAFVSLHPDLPATSVWRYRPIDPFGVRVEPWDFVAGPTFMTRIAENCGEGVVVRMQNELTADHVGFGVPDTTTHLHGGHHLARSDGFPDNTPGIGFAPVIKTGEEFDYTYPMRDPGFATGAPDVTERGSTMWYHDHLFDFTGPNVDRN